MAKHARIFLTALLACSMVFSLNAPVSSVTAASKQILVSNTAEMQSALQNVKAGDEIILRPGVYQPEASYGMWRIFEAHADGTPQQHIILRSEDPDNPATLAGLTAQSKCVLTVTGSYWEIRDLKIRNAGKGIFLAQSEHSIISGCEVYEIGDEAIHIIDDSSYNIVENCTVHDTGLLNPKYGEGVYIGSAKNATGYGFECHYNTVRGCHFGPNVTADHVDIKEYTYGNLVEYCTFDGTGIRGENGGDSFVEIKGNDAIVRYNTGYRNGCEKQLYGFDMSMQLEGWGQNNKIYDNTLYLDSEDCYIVKGWKCGASVFRNNAEPSACTYSGNRIMQVLHYRLDGDANEDGQIDRTDAQFLQDWLLGKTVPHLSAENADLNHDSRINAVDLALLKQKLLQGDINEKALVSVDFKKEDSGKWRMTNGLGEKTVTYQVAADTGSVLRMGWGCWDPYYIDPDSGKEGKWLQFSLDPITVDETGHADITVSLPIDATNAALEVYSYSDASGKRDADDVILEAVYAS